LKPENVLLDAEGHVKLGDFGLAKAGIQHPLEGAMSMCGTPEYMAPEILAQQGHGFCVDYWGLGMLVYEMMTGLPPWYTTDRTKLFKRLKGAPLDIPSYFSAASADCVNALLERNPRRRLGVTGIRPAMEHDFFRNISWRSLYARLVEPPIRPCEGWKAPEAQPQQPVDLLDNFRADGEPHMVEQPQQELANEDLEAATANFDQQFTRMPVESEDVYHPSSAANPEETSAEEMLNSNTFLGFTFDEKDRDSGQQLFVGTENGVGRPRANHLHISDNGDSSMETRHDHLGTTESPGGHRIS
jgi:serine/threonine protein kinase